MTVATNWKNLFEGETLDGWRVATGRFFDGPHTFAFQDCVLSMKSTPQPACFAGLVLEKSVPHMNYELLAEAKSVTASDFASITFPVEESGCTLLVGAFTRTMFGFSGQREPNFAIVPISFEKEKWYTVRIRVIPDRVAAWLDGRKVLDVPFRSSNLAYTVPCNATMPFGILVNEGESMVRAFRIRALEPSELPRTQPTEPP